MKIVIFTVFIKKLRRLQHKVIRERFCNNNNKSCHLKNKNKNCE